MLVLHFGSDRLANVFAILAYAPILLCLPVLLVVGVVFVVIPGGFIIVLGGLYYALVGFTGLLGLAVGRQRRVRASRVPPNTSSENASRSGRSLFGSRQAIAARPTAFGLTTDPTVGSAPNLELSRRGSDDINLVASRERGHVPDTQDGAQMLELTAIAEALPQPPGATSRSAPQSDSFARPSSLGPASRE